jgi:glyoxylase-like metal-dependent hydrolase (beta-lactamase superfamily II)
MAAIREPGKINENTTLIDVGMEGFYGIAGVYLVRGARTCLIDAGGRATAPRLVKLLGELDAFPPDLVIATHPHYDHAQGIPHLRRAAARLRKEIEVLASEEAIPLLADATFNDVFSHGPYESIRDVTPLRDGDTIDLGGLTLRVYGVPGHCRGHLAILDEKNGNLFVGDALGLKLSEATVLPPCMPPTWDSDAFLASVDRLKGIPYQTLCLAHFGCLCGTDAGSFPDEAVETWRSWWGFFERNADRLDDGGALLRAMRKELDPALPAVRPVFWGMKVLLALAMAAGTVTGTRTAIIDRAFFAPFLEDLATGYRMYTAAHPTGFSGGPS